MTSPSPVPPKRRLVEPSAWVNSSNRRSCCSSLIPIPVSMTAISIAWRAGPSSITRTSTSIPPTSVNFTALERKLLRIWRTRSGSPTWAGASCSSTFAASSRPLADAVCRKVSTRRRRRRAGRTSPVRSRAWPASIFEKSRVSPMIWSSECAELWAVATIWRCCGVRSVWASTSSMPVTPIIGVRISCDIAARNDDFAWLASSAACARATASCSARSRAPTSDSIAPAISLNAPATRSSSDTELTRRAGRSRRPRCGGWRRSARRAGAAPAG